MSNGLASLADSEVVAALASVGIGSRFGASVSGIVRGWPVSHARTLSNERTLCGRDASRMPIDGVFVGGPECHQCRKRWDALGADAALLRAAGEL